MSLSQFAITKAAATSKPFKLTDGFGLHLLVKPSGSKLWRFRYRFAGRENMLALGTFPATTLANARAKRDEARKLLEAGVDPASKRKEDKVAASVSANNTFGAIAAEVIANKEANDAASSTLSKNRWLLENLAAPLARRPIAEITAAARSAGEDIGGAAALSRYGAARHADITSRIWTIDLLNRSLLSSFAPVHMLRGLGLFALSTIAPMRQRIMREGIAPPQSTPQLMQSRL